MTRTLPSGSTLMVMPSRTWFKNSSPRLSTTGMAVCSPSSHTSASTAPAAAKESMGVAEHEVLQKGAGHVFVHRPGVGGELLPGGRPLGDELVHQGVHRTQGLEPEGGDQMVILAGHRDHGVRPEQLAAAHQGLYHLARVSPFSPSRMACCSWVSFIFSLMRSLLRFSWPPHRRSRPRFSRCPPACSHPPAGYFRPCPPGGWAHSPPS